MELNQYFQPYRPACLPYTMQASKWGFWREREPHNSVVKERVFGEKENPITLLRC